MFATDTQHLLASLVSLRLRSHVNATLHLLHAATGGVVGHVQQCGNLAGRVELVWLQLHDLFTSTFLEAPATRMRDQFINVLPDLVKIGFAPRISGGHGHRPQTANLVRLQNAHALPVCTTVRTMLLRRRRMVRNLRIVRLSIFNKLLKAQDFTEWGLCTSPT